MELYFNNMRKAYDTLIHAIRTDEMVQAVIKRQDSLVKIMEKASIVFKEQELSDKKRILQNESDLASTIAYMSSANDNKTREHYRNLVSDTLLYNLVMRLIFSEIEQRYETLFGSLRSYEKGDFEFHYKVYKSITDDQRSFLRGVRDDSLGILEMYLDKTKTKIYNKNKIELALSKVYDALCFYYSYQLYDTGLKKEGSNEHK